MRTIDLHIPSSFGEMTPKQIDYFSRVLTHKIPAIEVKIHCFLNFTGLKLLQKNPLQNQDGQQCYLFSMHGKGRFLLDVERFAAMIERLSFLENDVTLFDLPVMIKSYKACDSKLYGMRLDEWLLADTLYGEYSRTKDEKLLHMMMAIFYRKPGEKWDEGNSTEARAKRFRNVPVHRKYIVYLWYTGVKLWLMEKYWFVFHGDETSGSTPHDEIFMGMISSLNEGKVADNATIKATEVHEVLYELNRKIETSNNLKGK
jgi:hypothetical protein